MTDEKYINRLVDWIRAHTATGATLSDELKSDLSDLGNRIDALDDADHKGAHATVSQQDASRFITGVYFLIGDTLRLRNPATS